MRRAIITAILLVLFNPAMVHADVNVRHCSFQGLDSGTWTTREVQRTIICTANRFGVSSSTALAVAWDESRYNEGAFNYGGCGGAGCGGLFQHHMSYWAVRADAYPDWQRWWHIDPSDCWCNPRIQSLVTIKMVQYGGWGPWGQ